MPTLKTTILGTQIEINFNKNEQNKLQRLIDSFQKRLEEYSENKSKVSDSKIFLLTALKLEDELEEIQSLVKNNLIDKNSYSKQNKINEKLIKEIIYLKDKLNETNLKDSNTNNIKENIDIEINKIEKTLDNIKSKILSKNEI